MASMSNRRSPELWSLPSLQVACIVIVASLGAISSAFASQGAESLNQCALYFEPTENRGTSAVAESQAVASSPEEIRAFIDQALGFKMTDSEAAILAKYKTGLSPTGRTLFDSFISGPTQEMSQLGFSRLVVDLIKRKGSQVTLGDLNGLVATAKASWFYLRRYEPLVVRRERMLPRDVKGFRERIQNGEDAFSESFQAEMDARITEIDKNREAQQIRPSDRIARVVRDSIDELPHLPFVTVYERETIERAILRLQGNGSQVQGLHDQRLRPILESLRDRRIQILKAAGRVVDLTTLERPPYAHLFEPLFGAEAVPARVELVATLSSFIEKKAKHPKDPKGKSLNKSIWLVQREGFDSVPNFKIQLDPEKLRIVVSRYRQLRTLFSESPAHYHKSLNAIFRFFLKTGRFPVSHVGALSPTDTPFQSDEAELYQEVGYIFVLLKNPNPSSWSPEFREDFRYFFNHLRRVIAAYY